MLDWTRREREEREAEGEEIGPDEGGKPVENADEGQDAA
jgi:hypothetical protein